MIKDVIKKLRELKNLSQDELAKFLNLPRYIISNWEQGRTEPSIENLKAICDFFDITADELIERNTDFKITNIAINNNFNNSSNINVKIK